MIPRYTIGPVLRTSRGSTRARMMRKLRTLDVLQRSPTSVTVWPDQPAEADSTCCGPAFPETHGPCAPDQISNVRIVRDAHADADYVYILKRVLGLDESTHSSGGFGLLPSRDRQQIVINVHLDLDCSGDTSITSSPIVTANLKMYRHSVVVQRLCPYMVSEGIGCSASLRPKNH